VTFEFEPKGFWKLSSPTNLSKQDKLFQWSPLWQAKEAAHRCGGLLQKKEKAEKNCGLITSGILSFPTKFSPNKTYFGYLPVVL